MSSLLTVLPNFVPVIQGREMFALNAGVLKVSYLHLGVQILFLYSWKPSMLYYEMETKGGYLFKKMILQRHYCQYEKKHYGMVNSLILHSHYIYHYQKGPALSFAWTLRSHLAQQNLCYLMSFCKRNVHQYIRSWP